MKKLLLIILLAVMVLAGCGAPAAPEISPELAQRLDRLVEKLEQMRETHHVPGMAIAVVKDDEVVLTRGFGVTDIEENTPVEPETIFAIGSTTKAFTSAVVSMMVDEGKMDWDDPVTRYLPYFTMEAESDEEGAEITLRDVLSHRSGYPRMGVLFGSGKIPREEVLQDATAGKPYAPLGERFYYSNVMYTSAGVAAGKVAGSDWDTLVEERIFRPLDMDSTTTSVTEAEKDSRLAMGYLWDEDLQAYEYRPIRNVNNIGPAGSINSNVIDMAEWLRLQLGKGEYEGKRLISEESLQETWTKQIDISASTSYAMGWMVGEWEGQQQVEHGGNVDGFSAQVAMLPESNLGFVLLTNAMVSPLPSQAINVVWETLLGEEPEDGVSIDYELYLGEYIANFGSFVDEKFTVLVQNGRLALDIPGQQVYELKNPDEEGLWYFASTDEIAVSFDKDEDGNVVLMKMYQSGLIFEIPREGTEIAAEIPLEELQKYLGSYTSEELGITVTVVIQNNRLGVDVPGQMVYELYPPDEEGKWYFRVTDEVSVGFSETSGGQVEGLTMYQAGMEFYMPLTESKRLPTVAEIMELRDAEGSMRALEAIGDYKVVTTSYIEQCGVQGEITFYVSGSDKYRVEADYGKYGGSIMVLNGDHAWVESSFGPFQELRGQLLEQAKRDHPYVMGGDWRDYFDSIKVSAADTYEGRDVYIMTLKHGDLPAITVLVDSETGDILLSQVNVLHEGGIGIPVTVTSEDFRVVHGIRSPARSISTNEQTGRSISEDVSYEINLHLDDDLFILTPPEE